MYGGVFSLPRVGSIVFFFSLSRPSCRYLDPLSTKFRYDSLQRMVVKRTLSALHLTSSSTHRSFPVSLIYFRRNSLRTLRPFSFLFPTRGIKRHRYSPAKFPPSRVGLPLLLSTPAKVIETTLKGFFFLFFFFSCHSAECAGFFLCVEFDSKCRTIDPSSGARNK